MLNASDRNNNVWTTGLDPTQLIALCKDRAGKTAKLVLGPVDQDDPGPQVLRVAGPGLAEGGGDHLGRVAAD
jgi:hypothetical protein